MFESVLIANRGEIACRIIRTARRLGLRTIAVFSSADRHSLHVRMADEAIHIGPAPAALSYLNSEAILNAARQSSAQCIHPGYGFLAENAPFAAACTGAGITFIGPSEQAITAMGQKDAAKTLMADACVPVVPGYHGDRQDVAFLKMKAYEIGYPVLIKAVSGGGGKGMRRVDKVVQFEAALESAQREAENAFGDQRVLLESFVRAPRHVEIQVFGDAHGNIIHLSERDCSLQRRHQKVIEEAPAPAMPDEVRAAMGQAAVAAAKAVGYQGAGTVEFIADGSQGLRRDRFWFMEMNTRLQVEHPVTEMVTGTDLVEWQFRIAFGEELPLRQADVSLNGHAVEARLYAEDPANGFLPSTGRLWAVSIDEGEGLRVDNGVAQGDEISPHYDPMIAKVIAHGASRKAALDRLSTALKNLVVAGPRTNAGFLGRLINHRGFVDGAFDTGFIDAHIDDLTGDPPAVDAAVAAATGRLIDRQQQAIQRRGEGASSPWALADGFQYGGPRHTSQPILVNGEERLIAMTWEAGGFSVAGERNSCAGPTSPIRLIDAPGRVFALHEGFQTEVCLVDQLSREAEQADGIGQVRAPMHGRVIAVTTELGAEVAIGDPLFCVEAMKMEHAVAAPVSGIVVELNAIEGDQVDDGALMVLIENPEQQP